jgi:uncharacterized protein (TIGR01777 family)
MHIAITGSHGLIAGRLIPELERAGHTVVRLVRAPARPGEVRWDPDRGELDVRDLSGVEAAVHLAGAGVAGRRWNDAYKRRILESRVKGTTLLAERLAELRPLPRALVSASAIGYYGNRGDEVLTETAAAGDDFLAQVCIQWEAATAAAATAGVRTVSLRSGIVQSVRGGVLKAQLIPFKLALGARIGRGRDWISWIHEQDEVGAIRHAVEHDDVQGPLNLTAPEPVSNAEYTRTLAAVLRRPALLAIPPILIEVALGREMAHETVLASQRALPAALERSGYTWRHPQLNAALRDLLIQSSSGAQ